MLHDLWGYFKYIKLKSIPYGGKLCYQITMKPEHQIPYLISSLRVMLYGFIEAEFKKNGIKGLSYTHGAVLFALYQNNGAMRLSDIAVLINRTKPTVTVMVDKLEAAGYVNRVRSVEDSRVTMVEVTDKGYAISDVFDTTSETLKKKAFKGIKKTDQEKMIKLLGQVVRNLSEP